MWLKMADEISRYIAAFRGRLQYKDITWWRHQMETFSALLALCVGNSPATSPVAGEFPTQSPVTRSFDVFFDLGLNKRLSKRPWGWWFQTISWSLWRHRNDLIAVISLLTLANRWSYIFVHGAPAPLSYEVQHFCNDHFITIWKKWRHNEPAGVWNRRCLNCLLNCWFR